MFHFASVVVVESCLHVSIMVVALANWCAQ